MGNDSDERNKRPVATGFLHNTAQRRGSLGPTETIHQTPKRGADNTKATTRDEQK